VDIETIHHREGEHTRTERIRHKRKDKDTFLSHRQMVFEFDGGVPAGQWSFPFQLDLPEWCPSSIFYCGQKESKLQITYKIEAEIEAENGEDAIEAKRRIIVRRPPTDMATGQHLDNSQQMTACCCIDQGTGSMKVNFEKNAYTPYEVAKCFVEVNNTEGKIPINNISFTLKRKIWAKAGQHILNVPDMTMCSVNFPGIEAGENKPKEHMSLDLNTARDNDRFFISRERKEGVDAYEEEDLAIQKEPMQPTAIGQIVHMKYYLEIRCNYGGNDCCREVPECELPMTLFA